MRSFLPILLLLLSSAHAQPVTTTATVDADPIVSQVEANIQPTLDAINAQLALLAAKNAAQDARLTALESDTPPPVDPPPVNPPPVDPPSGTMSFGFNAGSLGYWLNETPWTDLMLGPATWRQQAGSFVALQGSGTTPPAGNYLVVPANAATVDVGNSVRIKPNAGFENGNFAVYLPGFGPDTYINPRYREIIRSFRAQTMRTMDWQQTNNSPDTLTWAQRMKPGDRRTDDKWDSRIPLETIYDTAGALKVNLWVCVPHGATDDYCRGMARLALERLPATTIVYVEFSNELWNSPFPQSRWIRDSSGKIDHARWAAKIKWMADIWRQEWGAAAGRLRIVLAGQETNTDHQKQVAQLLPPNTFDVMSCAAYFGNGANTLSAAVDDIRGKKRLALVAQKALADEYTVPLCIYEGGQHLALSAPVSLQRSQEMHDAYAEHYNLCQETGIDLYLLYNLVGPYTDRTRFPHLEYMTQPLADAPKFRATVEAAR